MSSSNAVQLIMIPETSYGVTPPIAPALPVMPIRYVSETLSGTPQTAESAEARSDRMSGGQVVTGLDSGGEINTELSHGITFDELIRMAMMSSWTDAVSAAAPGAATHTKDVTNPQLADLVVTGLDWGNIDGAGAAVVAGDLIVLNGFTNPQNNGPRVVSSVTSPTTVKIIVPRDSTTETLAAFTPSRPRYLDIGQELHSATFSKAYTDVTHLATTDQHSQSYPGGLVNQWVVNLVWGAIAQSNYTIIANGYRQEAPSLAQQVTAGGGTIPAAETQNPLNASIDVPTVSVDGQPTDFCIQSMDFTLANGLTPQNCIGHIAATKFNLGKASISVKCSIYLGDQSYDKFMPAKLTQTPVSFLFAVANQDGGYAFDFRAVQLSFPDPASGGADQQVMIEATGVAKVGPNGSSAMRVYDLGTP